jgi:hypothetical protein
VLTNNLLYDFSQTAIPTDHVLLMSASRSIHLATLSLPVMVFVIAMAIGMLIHDLRPVRTAAPTSSSLADTTAADG